MVLIVHEWKSDKCEIDEKYMEMYNHIKTIIRETFGLGYGSRLPCNEFDYAIKIAAMALVDNDDISNLKILVDSPIVAVLLRAVFRALDIHAVVRLRAEGGTTIEDLRNYINLINSAISFANMYS